MKKLTLPLMLLVCSLVSCAHAQVPVIRNLRPFPHAVDSARMRLGSYIIPDQSVKTWYDRWKSYLHTDQAGRYYVRNDERGEQGKNRTTSEANGYGMIIEALMAGYDPNARRIFNGLYNYAMFHHSDRSSLLMRWRVKKHGEQHDKKESDTAIDGDLDMAYALLVAEKQWGDLTGTNYGKLADATLAVILAQEVDTVGLKLLRGNAENETGSWQYNTIRISDYMPAHFRAFFQHTRKTVWLKMISRYDTLYSAVQDRFSPRYHLFPEYLVIKSPSFETIPSNVTDRQLEEEGIDDGGRNNKRGDKYGFNSCRVPLRIAMDYLTNGDQWSLVTLQKLSKGMRIYTSTDACMLTDVYPLDNNPVSRQHKDQLTDDADHHSADLNVIGPLYLASLTDEPNPQWQGLLFKQLMNDQKMPCSNNDKHKKRNYYENTLRMLCLILLNGSYWSPTS